jgi:phosphatidylglycerophosphate synthase
VTAALHTVIFTAATVALVELALLRFRKIPFTCAYPAFQSQTALTFVAYLFGAIFFTIYLPEIELWSLGDPWRTLVFPPIIAVALFSVHAYRKQMLDMDKQLIFEESSSSGW